MAFTAQIYLEEWKQPIRFPAECKDDDFAVRAEFCHFLSLPDQLGEPPAEISLVGSQVLVWPPTGDRRRMSVVRFKYVDERGWRRAAGKVLASWEACWLGSRTLPTWKCRAEMCLQPFTAATSCEPRCVSPDKIDAATGLALIRAAQR
ncbi:MAG: hypothetical protein R3B96_14205 [Pirellulaceae bacterium]